MERSLLDLAGRLFLDPGDAVVVERPTFAGALAAFQMQRPIYLGVDLEADGIDDEHVDARFHQRLDAIVRRQLKTPAAVHDCELLGDLGARLS